MNLTGHEEEILSERMVLLVTRSFKQSIAKMAKKRQITVSELARERLALFDGGDAGADIDAKDMESVLADVNRELCRVTDRIVDVTESTRAMLDELAARRLERDRQRAILEREVFGFSREELLSLNEAEAKAA